MERLPGRPVDGKAAGLIPGPGIACIASSVPLVRVLGPGMSRRQPTHVSVSHGGFSPSLPFSLQSVGISSEYLKKKGGGQKIKFVSYSWLEILTISFTYICRTPNVQIQLQIEIMECNSFLNIKPPVFICKHLYKQLVCDSQKLNECLLCIKQYGKYLTRVILFKPNNLVKCILHSFHSWGK